jgi:hypothetical protein
LEPQTPQRVIITRTRRLRRREEEDRGSEEMGRVRASPVPAGIRPSGREPVLRDAEAFPKKSISCLETSMPIEGASSYYAKKIEK